MATPKPELLRLTPDVCTIATLFSAGECASIRAAMDRGTPETAEVLGAEIASNPEVRQANSIEVDAATLARVEHHLDAQRQVLRGFFGITPHTREGTGFLRYPDGAFYKAHRDRAHVASWPGAARRRISIVVFLNSGDFSGGELRLYSPGGLKPCGYPHLDVIPRGGTLVAFAATMLHEVLPVRGGTRDVLVDWFY